MALQLPAPPVAHCANNLVSPKLADFHRLGRLEFARVVPDQRSRKPIFVTRNTE